MSANKDMIRLTYKSLKLTHLKRKMMTVNNIAYSVAKIMKDHIGIEKAITSDTLFQQIYLHPRKADYVDDFRWDYIKKAMHRLRQSEKLFIVNTILDKNVVWLVPCNQDEAMFYVNRIENNIKRQRLMQERVKKSVREEWYKLDWVYESKMLTQVEENIENQKKLITLERKKFA